MTRRLRFYRAGAMLILLVFAVSAFATMVLAPYPIRAVSGAPGYSLLYDDFTHDASLNASLWQLNGPVGSVFGPDDVGGGGTVIPLEPAFSSKGMEIAQANASYEVGTIQSIEYFTPPFTATAVVEGTISNGHTFGFAIASANASSGVVIYGNLNPTNCSHLGDCNDTSVCGISANSAIPPNQCYYGMDAKIGKGGGSWGSKVVLYPSPSVNVTYTLQISVSASGSAQYGVSQGSQLLGQKTVQVGTGPFYLIIEQGEGAPVLHPGPNQAFWFSVGLTSGTPSSTTTSASTSTQPGPAPAPGGLPWFVWVIIIIIAALFFFIILWYRRRGFTVRVLDSQTNSPIRGAAVTARGPENLSGIADKDGKAKFGSVDEGEYAVGVTAPGYITPAPVTIKVKKKTEYTARLAPTGPGTQGSGGENTPLGAPGPVAGVVVPSPGPEEQQPQTGFAKPPQGSAPHTVTQPGPEPPPEQQVVDLEGFGGPRMRQIIRTFQEKGAVSPETALTADELGLSRLFVRVMKRRQGKTRVFIEINGKYYLNQKALQEMQ